MTAECPACHAPASPGAKFCAQCGTPLAPRCPSCGAEHGPEARFCAQCGTPLTERPAPSNPVGRVLSASAKATADRRSAEREGWSDPPPAASQTSAIERRHMTFVFCDL